MVFLHFCSLGWVAFFSYMLLTSASWFGSSDFIFLLSLWPGSRVDGVLSCREELDVEGPRKLQASVSPQKKDIFHLSIAQLRALKGRGSILCSPLCYHPSLWPRSPCLIPRAHRQVMLLAFLVLGALSWRWLLLDSQMGAMRWWDIPGSPCGPCLTLVGLRCLCCVGLPISPPVPSLQAWSWCGCNKGEQALSAAPSWKSGLVPRNSDCLPFSPASSSVN